MQHKTSQMENYWFTPIYHLYDGDGNGDGDGDLPKMFSKCENGPFAIFFICTYLQPPWI